LRPGRLSGLFPAARARGFILIGVDEVITWVEKFDPHGDPRAMRSRQETLDLLRAGGVALERTAFTPGHVTASAIVLSRDGARVLLVYHPRLGRWLQPGGHLESGDTSVVRAATREVLEETGVPVDSRVVPALVGVDVHEIPPGPGEPAHRHHDLCFRFVAADRAPAPPPASLTTTWCPVERLAELGPDPALQGAVGRAVRRF
jgi:8-oxo-dGTP pyrophosphatase MutT (NUDIX family)